MKTYYNYSVIKIQANDANKLIVKGQNSSPFEIVTIDADNNFVLDSTGYAVGTYYIQYVKDDVILSNDRIEIRQNLLYADDDYDPRSNTEITLEAIDAMLEGRANSQHRKVQIGDKSIEYSTLEELLNWKKYYLKKLRQEQNKSIRLKAQTTKFI